MRQIAERGILLLFLTAAAFADVVTISLNYTFSGTPLTGAPYPTATFTDIGGRVQLVMDATGLYPDQYVSEWYFNLSDFPAGLMFTHDSGVLATGITVGPPPIKADGDGYYDIRFSFPTTGTFLAPLTSTYWIDGAGLTAMDFYSLSTGPNGKSDKGGYLSAIHVQGGGFGTAWIGAVPEPTSYPVYATVMAVLCAGIWRRIRSRSR